MINSRGAMNEVAVSDIALSEPKISVIVPVWNRVNTVERAIRSALGQTQAPQEVIVCDDGSTDGTAEILKRLAAEDSRVRLIWSDRSGGPARPRNQGIAQALGDWVAFLDSDDEWLSSKLQIQSAVARRTGSLAVCSNVTRFIPTTQARSAMIDWSGESLSFEDLVDINRVICSSVLLHRGLLSAVGGFPEMHGLRSREDYALWLRVSLLTDFAYVPQELVLYRDEPATSIRGGVSRSEWLKTLVMLNLLIWCSTRRPSRLAHALTTVVRRLGSDMKTRILRSGSPA